MPPNPLTRLRKLCLALPEAHEVEAWGEPGSRRSGAGAAPGNQSLMVRASPERFFVPPYVGPSGWVGVWLDQNPDWAEVSELMLDSYRLTAPKRLQAMLDQREPR